MALVKEVRQADGVTTNYHVVSSISSNTGLNTAVTVTSYIDEASALEAMSGSKVPYRRGEVYMFPYDEGMTRARAYKFLLAQEKFEGAESTDDIPEDVTAEEFISMLEEVM